MAFALVTAAFHSSGDGVVHFEAALAAGAVPATPGAVGVEVCFPQFGQRCSFKPDFSLGRALALTFAKPFFAPVQAETTAPTAERSASCSRLPSSPRAASLVCGPAEPPPCCTTCASSCANSAS